jgi:hypothetical protein
LPLLHQHLGLDLRKRAARDAAKGDRDAGCHKGLLHGSSSSRGTRRTGENTAAEATIP